MSYSDESTVDYSCDKIPLFLNKNVWQPKSSGITDCYDDKHFATFTELSMLGHISQCVELCDSFENPKYFMYRSCLLRIYWLKKLNLDAYLNTLEFNHFKQ